MFNEYDTWTRKELLRNKCIDLMNEMCYLKYDDDEKMRDLEDDRDWETLFIQTFI